jgi:6-pyruvoyltetrahydropterin/6-carboxytetrahydropterin synthase
MSSQLILSFDFCCGHRYRTEGWTDEENRRRYGLCFSEHGHGHTYHAEIVVDAESAEIFEATIEGEVKLEAHVRAACTEIAKELDHKHLNFDVPHFKSRNPTTENIAIFILERLRERGVPLHTVTLFEGQDLGTVLGPEFIRSGPQETQP